MPFVDIQRRREYQREYYHRRKALFGPRTRTPEQREKQRVAQRRYDKKRAQTIPWKMKNRLRVRLRYALLAPKYNGRAKKCNNTMRLTGCTTAQLCDHLQKQFTEGMSWDNYGQWHIDHIKPCAAFDLTDDTQQHACFHFTNLQPLWATDNLRKGARVQ